MATRKNKTPDKAALTVECETGIPLPSISRNGKRESKYHWATMGVGDSRFIPGGTTKQVSAAAHAAKIKYGYKLTVRSVEGGVRVWRLEDDPDDSEDQPENQE